MTASQIPILIALVVALVVVLALLAQRLRGDVSAPSADVAETPSQPNTRLSPASSRSATTTAVSAATGTTPLKAWGYQLQNFDVAVGAGSPIDLLVIDPATDGTDDTALTPNELSHLKRKPDGSRRLVLAYLSIGEAEDYRSYWDNRWDTSPPPWLLGENKEWKGNYSVCFWHPDWQALIFGSPSSRLDRILAAGFDGVYLDKCDVTEDLKRHFKSVAASRPDLAGDMVRFVGTLSAYAKRAHSDFLVVMQNAEDLLESDDLRSHLDGSAKEELVYGGNGPEKLNAPADLNESRRLLDLMRADGKFVLAVEYLNDAAKTQHALETLRTLGYVPCISPKNRKLDTLREDAAMA